jgi:hypothetical protein
MNSREAFDQAGTTPEPADRFQPEAGVETYRVSHGKRVFKRRLRRRVQRSRVKFHLQ